MLFLTIILFLLILSILVLVHEFGHFYVAKKNGVFVEEFGLGYPPRICGWYKSSKTNRYRFFWRDNHLKREDVSDTIYSLNFIPLGGFCKMLGEDEQIRSKKSFSEKSPWIRFKIIIAGVTLNFLLAWILFSLWLYLVPAYIDNNVVVISVVADSKAQEIGIKQNDFISKINNEELKDSNDLIEFTKENKGQEVAITIKRYNEEKEIVTTLPDKDQPLGVSLADTGGEVQKYPWYLVPFVALDEMLLTIWISLTFLWQLILSLFTSARAPSEAVSGPVGVFSFLYQIIGFGWLYVIRFTALISLALAFFNLLPIPALDGGRLAFIIPEMIFKKKIVAEKVENAIHVGGFFVLIILLVLVTYNDIVKLVLK